ncbi:MAG: class I SAM-dependent methyltransferase [Gemmatimonadetes bacterium]|nr:class I SAM-dependent methyltransferase [Gemmatimonadota bacterium]
MSVDEQQQAFDKQHADLDPSYWWFHDTKDPLVRYLRDRRIRIGVAYALGQLRRPAGELDALVVCGGVGGEGTLLANLGFRSVTVSDFSASALDVCRGRDPRLKTIVLDAERLELPDASYDVVLVQDGLHHLPRPALGFTEMLRVARHAAIVVEPHTGIVASALGTNWEREDGATNWVFRWNRTMLEQLTNSYCLDAARVRAIRVWDHNVVMGRVGRLVGGGRAGLALARLVYGVLDATLWWCGNMMIGVVLRTGASGPA